MDNAITFFSDFQNPTLQLPNIATSSLLLMSSVIPKSEGIIPFISSISLIPSYAWFFALTPFEAIFLGFIIVQICVLNAIGVLPVNLNLWFKGNPAGRKKRHAPNTLDVQSDITKALLNTLERVDREQCFLRALCLVQLREMEKMERKAVKSRDELTHLLHSLKRLPNRRPKDEDNHARGESNDFLFSKFHDAIWNGSIDQSSRPAFPASNSTSPCEKHYGNCQATDEDIYVYVDHIKEYYLKR